MMTSNDQADTAGQLHRSALRLLRLLRDTLPAKGLGGTKLSVLGRLYRNGASTPSALAVYLRVQPQSLTRLIGDLERRMLISRRPDTADRRQSLLEITEAGGRLLGEEMQAQRNSLERLMVRELSATERELLRLAAGLIDRLAAAVETRSIAAGEKE
jgi:DNA-binding MarR family transcriptional regulator